MRLTPLVLLFLPVFAAAQPRTDTLLTRLLATSSHPLAREIANNPDTYRLQVIYTRIDRDRRNRPSFQHFYFNYDPNLYFNPASMVKLPLAILALEKLKRFRGVDRETPALFDSSRLWHRPLHRDTSARDGVPTIGHLVKRALLISENDPYNRLYQFVGQGETNRRLHAMGWSDVRITRQFLGLTESQNRITNPVRFVDAAGNTIGLQPEQSNTDSFDFSRTILLGNAYMNARDSLIRRPFDFTRHNNLSLGTMQGILQSVLFPAAVPRRQRFRLGRSDRDFLLRYLSQYPSETPDPKYDTGAFYDSYVKFFFRDSTRRMPPGVRVFNKVGWSYGFLTDVSYVADFNNKVEYMLAATVYVNKDGILNDGKYEYSQTGWPFLYQLGQVIYQYELARRRVVRPDLSAFRISYEQRDPNDQRPALKEVDN